jgi:hypothetical protein
MNFIRKKQISILFLLIGAVGGFLYWKFVGCKSGTCPIKSVWYWTTLWGAAIGYLIGDFLNDFLEKRKNKKEKNSASEI